MKSPADLIHGVRIRGESIHVHEMGAGAPLLVMHGGMGFDHTYFLPSLRSLAATSRVILYDHRGNGQSSRPDPDTLSLETWADDAIALADALGLDRFALLAHSFGGFVGLELASRFSERLAGLVLCSTAAALDYTDVAFANAQGRATPEQLAAVTRGLTAPSEDDAAFRDTFLTALPIYFSAWETRYRESFEHIRYDAAASNRGLFGILPQYNMRDRLKAITAPTLVLVGHDDWLTPPSQAAAPLVAGIGGATMHEFQRSGHFPFIEEPAAFASVVRDWLARQAL